MEWLGLSAAALLFFGLAACPSGGSGGVDASGSGGSGHAGGGGGGAARNGTGGLGGQAGTESRGGASVAGQSGSQGGGATAGVGGSGGTDGGCNVAYDCPAGETCLSHAGTNFTCVPSGSRKAGDPCDVSADAAVVCGDQLICAQTTAAGGLCTQFCDSTLPCPAGKTCTTGASQAGQPLSLCL